MITITIEERANENSEFNLKISDLDTATNLEKNICGLMMKAIRQETNLHDVNSENTANDE